MQSESEVMSESPPVVRIRSLSVDERSETTENDVDIRNGISSRNASALGASQHRAASGRFCRKCGHVITVSQ
jgi:hypothetical protein